MRILVVHEVSYHHKPVYEFQDFAERLAARGHDVLIVDLDESGTTSGNQGHFTRSGVAQVKVFTLPQIKTPVLNILSARIHFERWLNKQLKDKAFDVVFLYSVFVNGTNTVRLCKKFGVPVVYRVLDVYHKIRQNPLIQWPLYFGEKFIYRNAQMISATNDKMADYVRTMAQPSHPNVSVLHHGVDTDFFYPRSPDPELALKLGLSAHHATAVFLGTTFSFSGLATLIGLVPTIQKNVPEFRLIIVGGGEAEQSLRHLVSQLRLDSVVHMTGMRPYNEVPRYLSLAQVAVQTFEINDVTRDIVPIKILQYLASGLAVVATQQPDVMRLFPTVRSGIHFADLQNDSESYISLLTRMLTDKDFQKTESAKALRFAQTDWAMNAKIDRLESMLAQTIKQFSGGGA